MKSSYTIVNWSKKNDAKKRSFRLMGRVFILFALALSLFPLLVKSSLLSDYIAISSEEREGYFMMAIVFFAMGIFCQAKR